MLTALQKFAKSPFAWGLFGLLILSFLIFGIGDVFTRQFTQDVVNAGDRKVSAAQYQQRFDQVLKNVSEQQNRMVTREEAISQGVPDQLLQYLVASESMGAAADRLNVRPSAALIAKQLEGNQAFFSQLTGKFDREAYQRLLAERGLTVGDFERSIADELASTAIMSAIQTGAVPPRTYGAFVALTQQQVRDLDYIFLDAAKQPAPAMPTDAQLTAMMNEPDIAPRLRKAETRDLSVVRFSTKAAAPSAVVSEADLKALYDFRLPAITEPELRSFIQIPAKDAAAAKAASDRLAKGEDPTAIAKSLGTDPVVYDQKPKSAVPDAKVRDAAFALQAGQVSGPVQGSLGYAALKVTQVTPGKAPTMAEMRPQLEMEKRKEIAQKTVFDAADRFEKAISGGGDFAAAARAAGVTPTVIPAVTREQGMPQQPGGPPPRPGLSPKLVEKAFGLSQGSESEIEDEGDGEYFVVRVDKVTPAAMPALDEVRATLTDAYLARQLQDRLSREAEALADKVRAGATLQSVAATEGLTVTRFPNATVAKQQELGQLLGQRGLSAFFGAKPNDVFVTPAGRPGFIVGKVVAVRPGDMTEMARAVDRGRAQIGQSLVPDILQLTDQAIRKAVKTKSDPERARATLGIEPKAATPATPAAPAKKDKAG